MINSFSHELRTPLNSATLFFKSALLDKRLDKSIRDLYILPGLSSLMRQSHLIDDIIDFS
jgi:signal transduction histidine kinase